MKKPPTLVEIDRATATHGTGKFIVATIEGDSLDVHAEFNMWWIADAHVVHLRQYRPLCRVFPREDLDVVYRVKRA